MVDATVHKAVASRYQVSQYRNVRVHCVLQILNLTSKFLLNSVAVVHRSAALRTDKQVFSRGLGRIRFSIFLLFFFSFSTIKIFVSSFFPTMKFILCYFDFLAFSCSSLRYKDSPP